MKKTKNLTTSAIEGEEKFQRTECNAETLLEVEKEILHPLIVDAMKLGWQTVDKGKYADRAGQVDPDKVDISLLFNIKGKERLIAGLLDHEEGSHKENIDGLRRALSPYIRPTINNYSYKDIAPEKMGVYIDQKALERNKASILHEAQCPGEKDSYCHLLKDALLRLDFSGAPLTRLQSRAYKKLKRYLLSPPEEGEAGGDDLLQEIARTDHALNTNRQGLLGIESTVQQAAELLKSLILRHPRRLICLLAPTRVLGLVENTGYWTKHNDDAMGILGYLQQQAV